LSLADNGFFWFRIRPWNFAKYQYTDIDEVHEIFGRDEWQRKQPEDVYGFIEDLKLFFSKIVVEESSGKE